MATGYETRFGYGDALGCQIMMRSGHGASSSAGDPPGPGPAILVHTFPMAAHQRFERHRHEEHQLAWATSGVLVVEVGEGVWVLPTSRALWIPAGVAHSVRASGPSTMEGVYLPTARCPVRWTEPTVIAVPALLRELIRYLAELADRPEPREHAEAVVFDLLRPVAVQRLSVPLPNDPRARRVAESVLTAPADGRSIDQWGRLVGTSGRTLARFFNEQTGMTFGRWRTEARLCAALPLLAGGATVAATARHVGYASTGAFVAAFRATVGTTPARYFADER
jgi:AraC-like DNA-binding protein/quercetin dioxygenase-like cupin family protein